MKILLFLFLACSTFAGPIRDQFRALVEKSDRIEIGWRPELGFEAVGISRVKKVFQKEQFAAFLSRMEFEEPEPPKKEELDEDVVAIVRAGNCLCDGSHLISFSKGEKLVAQVSLHHAMHLRSELLNDGHDAVLTPAAQEWLAAQIDWHADLQKIEALQKKEPNQPAQPTPGS
jgi:hypothetical protein